MSRYKLIAFDMDGTLLNSKKKILPETRTAMKKAAKAGKHVVLASGRPLAELSPYMGELPFVRYIVASSGSLVYDMNEKTLIFEKTLAPDTVFKLFEIAKLEKDYDGIPMINIHTDMSFVQRDQASHMKDYCMAPYQTLYDAVSTKVDNIFEFYKKTPFPAGKVNLYHKSTESRERSRLRIIESGLINRIYMANCEIASIESTPEGVSKATGMKALCSFLNISMREIIAVGDSDNDETMLRSAGLGVAMGNSTDSVLKHADTVVSDNDHGGCSEAIEKYLLI